MRSVRVVFPMKLDPFNAMFIVAQGVIPSRQDSVSDPLIALTLITCPLTLHMLGKGKVNMTTNKTPVIGHRISTILPTQLTDLY